MQNAFNHVAIKTKNVNETKGSWFLNVNIFTQLV